MFNIKELAHLDYLRSLQLISLMLVVFFNVFNLTQWMPIFLPFKQSLNIVYTFVCSIYTYYYIIYINYNDIFLNSFGY